MLIQYKKWVSLEFRTKRKGRKVLLLCKQLLSISFPVHNSIVLLSTELKTGKIVAVNAWRRGSRYCTRLILFSRCQRACTWITKAERYLPFKAFKAVKVCGSCSPWHAERILAMNGCFGRIWPTHTSVSGITPNRRKALRSPPLPRTRRPPAFHVGALKRWRKDRRLGSAASQGAWGDTGGLKGGTANRRIKRLIFRRADCNIWTSDAMYRERGELRRPPRDLVLVLSPRQGRTNPPLDLSIPVSRRMACAEAGWPADVAPGSHCGYYQ